MSNLLLVIGFCSNDAPLAERLIDHCFALNERAKLSACLLVSAADVHEEMRTKIKLSAEVAFESVQLISMPGPMSQYKNQGINALFLFAAKFISKTYRVPWLWLEPDCVPLKNGWVAELSIQYLSQPKRYMGNQNKFTMPDGGTQIVMARTSIYPPDAINDISAPPNSNVGFNQLAENKLIERSTRTKLIQLLNVTAETPKDDIRSDAVLLHSDKNSVIMGRKNTIPWYADMINGNETPKIDLRTKAGRALKAEQQKAKPVKYPVSSE